MNTADISLTNQNLSLAASENEVRVFSAMSVVITPIFHLAAAVCFVGLKILKFLSLWHFWKSQQEPYPFEARLSDAAIDLLKIVAHPFAILTLEFLSFYGLFRPYEAQKLYFKIEEFIYERPLLTSFFPPPLIKIEKEVDQPLNEEQKNEGIKVSETEKEADLPLPAVQKNEGEIVLSNLTSATNINKESSIVEHAAIILRDYQQALLKTGKTAEEIDDIEMLFREYKQFAEIYSGEVKKIFQEATFLVVHGSIHVSHVALMVPVMFNFYQTIKDKRVINITEEEIKALQIAALFHDYGRTKQKNDLANDTEIMEETGAEQCRVYLETCGFDKSIAEKMKQAITFKDKNEIGDRYSGKSFENKCIFREILQNCDCIGYLRAHDASFNPKYLDVTRRLQMPDFKFEQRNEAFETLYRILDANKLFLMSIGDSPDDEYQPLSQKYEIHYPKFSGRASFEDKRFYETNPDCFEKMKEKMFKFEELSVS